MPPNEAKTALTVICVSYKRYREIHVLINSFLCQTLGNWQLMIIHDGPDSRMREEIQGYLDKHSNIEYMETDERYNDYGHSLREIGIKMASTPFLMMTNDDNYYVPRFLERMFAAIKQMDLDFAFCNMVSSHQFEFTNPPPENVYTNMNQMPNGTYVQPPYNVINSIPKRQCIDIGNFIVKTEIAKAVGFDSKGFYADGIFVENIMSRYAGNIKVGKIPQVLFVHN